VAVVNNTPPSLAVIVTAVSVVREGAGPLAVDENERSGISKVPKIQRRRPRHKPVRVLTPA
jgi:hypothetical protein